MDPVASRLPAVLGASAAMAVALISFISQASPSSCVMRAFAAFAVFAAFGIVIRYLIGDSPRRVVAGAPARSAAVDDALSGIAPGTSVEDLLAEEENE